MTKRDDAVATIVASYTKRVLEGFYNQFGQTEFVQKLQGQDPKIKYALEAGSYLITAFLEQKVARNTIFKKVLMDVATDAPPELAKRIINGARETIKQSATTKEETELANLILELDDEKLKQFLGWAFESSPEERERVLKHLAQFSDDEKLRLVQLPNEVLSQHTAVFGKTQSEPSLTATVTEKSPPGTSEKTTTEKLVEKIKAKRLQLKSQKKRGILW